MTAAHFSAPRARLRLVACVLAVSLVPGLSAPLAQERLDGRIDSVGRLVESSSVARRIAASGNARAQALHAEARDLQARARQAFEAGDGPAAVELLERATRVMMEGAHLASQGSAEKDAHDFDARQASVEALREALARIGVEKEVAAGDQAQTLAAIDEKAERARALKARGEVSEARKLLDEAYLSAKIGIERLRGGDTLVRSLTFADEREEYAYELDRNDTHRMLVDLLLGEKIGSNAGVARLVDTFMKKADELRRAAQSQAADGDFGAGVRSLEESTRSIVRAIRSAGVYIPG